MLDINFAGQGTSNFKIAGYMNKIIRFFDWALISNIIRILLPIDVRIRWIIRIF